MANRGRPTLYKPDHVEQARKMCLLGATNQELADGFEVDRSTIDNWLKAHPEFAAAVYEGRDGADAEIAQKLFERARGCSYEATKVVVVKGEVVKVTYTVNLLPDVRACTFWLRNRRRRAWREERAGAKEETRAMVDIDALEEAAEAARLADEASRPPPGAAPKADPAPPPPDPASLPRIDVTSPSPFSAPSNYSALPQVDWEEERRFKEGLERLRRMVR
jgi:hypothetical protein